MIGIIGAMDEEVAKIVEAMEIERQEDKACMSFKAGKLNGKDVVVVRSGIGKVNAAVCTQILVDDFGVDYVINTGIAGSLKAEINIADIVIYCFFGIIIVFYTTSGEKICKRYY